MGFDCVRSSFIAFTGCNPWILPASGNTKYSVALGAGSFSNGTALHR